MSNLYKELATLNTFKNLKKNIYIQCFELGLVDTLTISI